VRQTLIFGLFFISNLIFSQQTDSLELVINNPDVENLIFVNTKNSIGRQFVVEGKQIVNNIAHSYASPFSWKKDN